MDEYRSRGLSLKVDSSLRR
uniref:Uncharacterized protein n=1 Tax=Anguilla anguilla TaxID=7936 RepID=A0A0E9PCG9_ANGAN